MWPRALFFQGLGCVLWLVASLIAGTAEADELTVRAGGDPFRDGRVVNALKVAADGQAVKRSAAMDPKSPIYFYFFSQEFPGTGWQSFRPEEARKLLAEAGYRNGIPVVLVFQATERVLANSVMDHLTKSGFDPKPLDTGTPKEHSDRYLALFRTRTPVIQLTATRTTQEVPNLLGASLAVAQRMARKQGLGLKEAGKEYSSKFPKGMVFRQQPVAGTRVPAVAVEGRRAATVVETPFHLDHRCRDSADCGHCRLESA